MSDLLNATTRIDYINELLKYHKGQIGVLKIEREELLSNNLLKHLDLQLYVKYGLTPKFYEDFPKMKWCTTAVIRKAEKDVNGHLIVIVDFHEVDERPMVFSESGLKDYLCQK